MIRPTVSQPILSKALDLALGHPLGAERDEIFEVAGVAGAAPRPGDRLDPHAAVLAVNPSELVLDKATMAREIQMPPAAKLTIVHAAVGLPAHRARDPAAAQANPDDHPLPGQRHALDAGARKR